MFASIAGVGDFRQFIQYNRIDIWEKLGGKDRKDDMHTLGFKVKVPETMIATKLDANPFVDFHLKIAAFDLSGFYEAPYFYRIGKDRSLTKIITPDAGSK